MYSDPINWFIGGYHQTTNASNNPVTFFTGDNFTMPDIDDGRWHHLAVTYATSSDGQEVWLDGKRILSIPLKNEHFVDFSHPDTQINFGSLPPGHNSYFFSQVHLDRLRLHSGKLSSDQIQSLHQQDIDGDGLLDGWEYKYRKLGLDPLKKDRVGADIDGDGLDWLQEYSRVTHPGKKDSDGDGKNDKIDTSPIDPTNPPASERFSVLLGIGDKSGSLSENYDLNVYERNPQNGAETRVFTLTSGGHGQYKEEPKDFFVKGRSYTFQIDWQSTNGVPKKNAAGTVIDGADFDYTFKVVPQGNHGAVLIDSFQPANPGAQAIQLLSASANDIATSKSEFAQKYESRRVGLLPVEINHVNRGFRFFGWFARAPISVHRAREIYSGVFDGDMIEWRIPGLHSNLNISWFAEDQDGDRITGPSGAGVNYWQLSDSSDTNDPAGDKGLKWNPGRWKIICSINGIESTIDEFKLGWRTRKILVIGQIVPTTTHDPDKPVGAALSSWAEALADDFAYGLSYGGTGVIDQSVFDLFKAGFAQVPTKATESWMGYWSTGLPSMMPAVVPYVAPPLPPASIGPFRTSLGSTPRGALGTVTANQRYWMIQHLLNVNDDETSISRVGSFASHDSPE